MKYVCNRCQKSFTRHNQGRRKTWAKFCSRGCSDANKKESADKYAKNVIRLGKKQCKQCGKYLELSKFPPSKQSRTGYFAYCRPCTREKMRIADAKRADKRKIYSRIAYLKRTYKLSENEYSGMVTAQNGGCAICSGRSRLAIDHCHRTGKIRGLLCQNCNRGLGMFADDKSRLSQAIKYLS